MNKDKLDEKKLDNEKIQLIEENRYLRETISILEKTIVMMSVERMNREMGPNQPMTGHSKQ